MSRVVIEHLTKSFRGPEGKPTHAVRDVTLTVEDKELLVLVGPSGCGKTTTLRLLAGLEDADSGTISIDGQVVSQLPPRERDVAMVFQHHALYPHMSAYENMALGLKLRRRPKLEIAQRVGEAAEMLDLADCLERKPKELSGGQCQRVALGRALVRRPKLFLFDEPLSNLDAPMRAQMRAELSKLHRRLGATMLYITHDQMEAMTLGERIAVMNDGALQQIEAPLELYHHPATLFVAGFIGFPPMNLFHGTLVRQGNAAFFQERTANPDNSGFALRLDPETAAQLDNFMGPPVILGLRPEHITASSPATPAAQTVEAVAERLEPVGAEAWLHLRTAGHSLVARVQASCPAQPNQKVAVAFDPGQARFYDPVTEKLLLWKH